jgi:hypothetical protein
MREGIVVAMSLILPMLSPPSPERAVPFDRALLLISECLTDARFAEESGQTRHALLLYAVAERFAVLSGHLELMRLVWTYETTVTATYYE